MIRTTLTTALALASLVAGAGPVVADPVVADPVVGNPAVAGTGRSPGDAARFAEREALLVRRLVPGSADVVVAGWTRGAGYATGEVRFTTPGGPDALSVRVEGPGWSTPARVCALARCTGAVRQHDGGLVVFTEGAGRRTTHGFRGNGEVVSASVAATSSVADRDLAWFATDRVLTFAG
ncbi:hypothetical protein [Saccharothrix sp. Mg75]|uniref:hypothetical protein n=1 Tax=Saccharothrix sp. Mg75 TaxID=3445357 RepID=UPI003EEF83BF